MMPVELSVGKKDYEGDHRYHAEEVMFASGKYESGDFTVSINAWPCVGERGHNCHQLFKNRSKGRTITVVITGDHAGYAVNHNGNRFGATGTITYKDGVATYS
jgi:hypothetical protein